jgi:hypothetical protein
MSDTHPPSDPTRRPHPNAEIGGEGNNGLKGGAGESPVAETEEEKRRKLEEEELQKAVEDSFPASDPPAITQPVHRKGEPGGSR